MRMRDLLTKKTGRRSITSRKLRSEILEQRLPLSASSVAALIEVALPQDVSASPALEVADDSPTTPSSGHTRPSSGPTRPQQNRPRDCPELADSVASDATPNSESPRLEVATELADSATINAALDHDPANGFVVGLPGQNDGDFPKPDWVRLEPLDAQQREPLIHHEVYEDYIVPMNNIPDCRQMSEEFMALMEQMAVHDGRDMGETATEVSKNIDPNSDGYVSYCYRDDDGDGVNNCVDDCPNDPSQTSNKTNEGDGQPCADDSSSDDSSSDDKEDCFPPRPEEQIHIGAVDTVFQ